MSKALKRRIRCNWVITASLVTLLGIAGPAHPQQDKLLQRVQVVGGTAGTCPSVFISFDQPIMYRSVSFSADQRTATLVLVRDLAYNSPDADAGLIDTYPDQSLPDGLAVAISLDANRSTPILTMRFSSPVNLVAAQAGESSVVLLNIRPAGATSCGTIAPSFEGPAEPGDGITAGPFDEIEGDFQGARNAIVSGDYPQAIRLLTRLLSLPPHERSAEAQELLGLARERNGQFVQAQAEYETYLALYPNSDGAARVRQRLAGVMTAQATPRAPGTIEDGAEGPVLAGLPQEELPPVRARGIRSPFQADIAEEVVPRSATRGFLSSYYYRSQGSTVFTEFDTDTTNTDDQIFNDTLVTSLDFQGEFEGDAVKYSWRFAGDHELDFGTGDHQLSFSRAYVDVGVKSNGLNFRFGRQVQNDGGIQGRFDGVEVTVPDVHGTKVSAVLGSPVDSTKDGINEQGKVLFGLRATREDIRPGLDATVYAVHQTRDGYTDRQAVGVEAQYQKDRTSIIGIVDYDTYFDKVAFARLSGTWLRPDQSSFSVTLDHVYSPSLSFSNALTGQTVTTLSDLGLIFTTDQMRQLALDRTQETNSVTLAYSRPIGEKWQFGVDGSVYHTSGLPASGGVPAQPSPGTEYFGSFQFVGSNIFSDRDTVSVALRYANASTSNLILLDTYRRSDASDKMRLKPRLQLGYRQFTNGGTESFVVPSVNMTYRMNEQVDFEFEVGGRFSNRAAPSFTEEANELFLTAGFNKQF